MSLPTKHPTPPSDASGFNIFIRASYTTKYNFAVANYNAVSTTKKLVMRDFTSYSIDQWSQLFGSSQWLCNIDHIWGIFFGVTIVLSAIYIAISIYNAYVVYQNRNLLNATRFLRAKVTGPSGLDCEWVSVPLDSASANERLSTVEQTALDNVRREFSGQGLREIDCLVYTNRYTKIYPIFPRELLVHFLGFLVAIILGLIMLII